MKDVVSMNGNLQEALGPPTANSPLRKGFKDNIKNGYYHPFSWIAAKKTDF